MTELNGFAIEKWNQYDLQENVKYSTCPLCSDERKKNTQKCLTVFWEKGLGNCAHCGETLQLHIYKKRETEKKYIKPEWKNKTELSDKTIKFFESRNIDQDTIKALKITDGKAWMPQFQKEVDTMQFNYFIDNELINIKYRGAKKSFKLHKGSELLFWNLDSIKHETECYITEGELDTASLVQCGFHNTISVPNGATIKTANLEYLDNCIDYFENKEKIFLVLDKDNPGKVLENELLRRLGVERCYYFDYEGCKDANEYHIKFGGERLKQMLSRPFQYPLMDVITMSDDGTDLDNFLINGMKPGYGIGMKSLDDIFTIELGRYMIFTGVPTVGKTTILDHYIVRLNIMHGWKFAICNPENQPVFLHKERIITKILGYMPKGEKNVNSDAYKEVKAYIDDNFYFISFKDGRYNLEAALEKGKELIKRKGIKGLIIDPYVKIKLNKSLNKKINDYTSDYLNEIDSFCNRHNIFISIVAHPTKMYPNELGNFNMPTFYDVKGGGEFYDMSPLGLAANKDKIADVTTLKVLKVKFAHWGTNGAEVNFKYNINNGRLTEMDSFDNPKWDNTNWLREKQQAYQLNLSDIEDLPEEFENNF